MKVNIIYWTGTGNTQTMAEAIADGVKEAGGEAKLLFVSQASIDDIKAVDNLAFGCPAMGAEELEEDEMRPFMDEANKYLSGKKVLLFGSYEWAEGQWMEKWSNEVKNTGANLLNDGLIAYDSPDDADLEECRKMGREISK